MLIRDIPDNLRNLNFRPYFDTLIHFNRLGSAITGVSLLWKANPSDFGDRPFQELAPLGLEYERPDGFVASSTPMNRSPCRQGANWQNLAAKVVTFPF